MRALICIDGRSWEPVIRGATGYLEGGEAVLAHAVDERVPRGYGMAVRGLLGRRERGSAGRISAAAEGAATDLVSDARTLFGRLRPDLPARSLTLTGPPGEALVNAARDEGAGVVFLGRGAPGSRVTVVSGTVSGWRVNHHGEPDGLYLDERVDVRFPPHTAPVMRGVASEGAEVEVRGAWRGGHLHAFVVSDPASGERATAHEPPRDADDERPLGHTARFVLDHVACDVVVVAT